MAEQNNANDDRTVDEAEPAELTPAGIGSEPEDDSPGDAGDAHAPGADEADAEGVVEAAVEASEAAEGSVEASGVETEEGAEPDSATAAPESAPDATDADVPAEAGSDTDASDTGTPDGPTADADAASAEAATEPAQPAGPPTAVSLGLLPETFVSQVSTALHFYAPDIALLPPLPSDEDDEDDAPGRGRNRRRRGGNGGGSAPAERASRAVEVITEPQKIKGSTRLEAKKQRRRDGREAGRRRPVVTEAEFLARREAVDRQMIVRSKGGRVQIAVLEDKVLVEHYVARNQDASLIGNVYLGRVQNVLPSMEAAFVDIGRGRNAVLYSGEVDWDAVETGNQPRRIELALKPGDKVLVQVTKDPVGHKGARLTSQISLPGRYLVYVPGGAMNGISRKLPDTERSRLKKILKEVLPESSGVIVRTAAEGATEEQLTRDVNRLTAQWAHIQQKVEKGAAPSLLHSEPDLLVKIVRDVFNEDFTKMLIQGDDAYSTITTYLEQVAPDLLERVERYEGERDPFDEFRITEQIEKALDRKVWLPSGGSLVIDRTEAMTVIDVNTGKFVGSGGNLEETVTKNNLEAAEEIVRQLRLRDIGGIIVVDFIDMVLESNRDLVLRRLVECLSRDRTKHQVAEVTSLGLVQMTRKKLGLGLLETFSEPCEVCAGRGVIVHHDPVVKHRAAGNGNGSSRRGRGGNGGSTSNGSAAPSAGAATHTITEGVKSALAQIAASTIAPAAAPAAGPAKIDPALAIDLPEGPRADASGDDAEERPRKRRKRPAERERAERPELPATLKPEAEQLLDSVLNALPEPKAPGQGRGRSRRVTTAALTGTAVPVTPTLPSPTEP